MTEQPKYFEDALSNFVHDVASGGAIRHLVESGYSVNQIMERLDYPTPRERVEKTVYQYMIESGILLSQLPVKEEMMETHYYKNPKRAEIRRMLVEGIQKNGEENSYMLCSFGMLMNKDMDAYKATLADLTTREQDYILGVPWKENVMYHRLNNRMLEIGVVLAANPEYKYSFYFLRSREMIVIN